MRALGYRAIEDLAECVGATAGRRIFSVHEMHVGGSRSTVKCWAGTVFVEVSAGPLMSGGACAREISSGVNLESWH